MARARRRRRAGGRLLFAGLALLAIAAAAFWYWQRVPAPPAISPVHVDPANEGKVTTMEGDLVVVRRPRDPQLGIEADAVALERIVEMRQWQERCVGQGCSYELVWSGKPIASRGFREAATHANAVAFPFASDRFYAGELRMGAFEVNAALAMRDVQPVAFAVTLAQLPPNLAATFRDSAGALVTGDPARPAAGDLRVRYEIVPAGHRRLTGVQAGTRY